MLPIELVILRHGYSEGNAANKASRRGDNSFFTPEFRERHSRTFRLTDRGIKQATAAGEWIRGNITQPFDRFYVSDYIRAKETAAHLNLPSALWQVEFNLRERDHALMDNIPDDEKKKLFEMEVKQYELDPFLAYPAGGGESVASECLRLSAGILSHWSRGCSDKRVVCVCHGHVMRGLQLELEDMGHDDFIRLEASKEPKDVIRNCQILWYTRRDPETQDLKNHLVACRSVCPWDQDGDYGWRYIDKKKFTNEQLAKEVEKYPRQVNCA
jgi:broad specificity phosphatase PhoE